MKTKCYGAASIVLMLAAQAAHAAPVTYSTRAGFETATGGGTIETFNGYVADVSFNTSPFDAGAFTLGVIGPGVPTSRNKIDVVPDGPETSVNGTADLNLRSDAANTVFIRFDSPLSAFGGDFVSWADGSGSEAISLFLDGTLVDSLPLTELASGFFGVSGTLAFNEVRFSSTANDVFGLDNLTVARAAAVVPEPSTVALVGLALMGLAAPRLRKQ